MLTSKEFRRYLFLGVILLLTTFSSAYAQEKQKEKKAQPAGTPILWIDPEDISSRDLLLGPGGVEMQPETSDVTFLKVVKGGYSPKFRVRDGNGREWVAKLGREAQSETAAVRLLWAVGYPTETNYLVPCVHIKGAPAPKKKVARCEQDGFANVRFEARPDNVDRAGAWKWKRNPFVGTRELQGLLVMMALLNNWDVKDSNNVVIYVPSVNGEDGKSLYAISDLGATLGKTGKYPLLWRFLRNRNSPSDYAKSKFIEKVKGERVVFSFRGRNRGLYKNISIEQAKWIGGLLSRLNDQQIKDAFRAANYSPDEIELLTSAVRQRIEALERLPERDMATLTESRGAPPNE